MTGTVSADRCADTSPSIARCQADANLLGPAAMADEIGSIAAMPSTGKDAPRETGLAAVVRMRIIASIILLLMCLLTVWSSTHSDASVSSGASTSTIVWEGGPSVPPVLDEPAGDIASSLAEAFPLAAVALCLIGICVAAILLEPRFRLLRSHLFGARTPRRPHLLAVCIARAHPVTPSLTEMSLSRT